LLNVLLQIANKLGILKKINVTVGKAAWEACGATWNLGTNSAR
jgi:hypothetical protein